MNTHALYQLYLVLNTREANGFSRQMAEPIRRLAARGRLTIEWIGQAKMKEVAWELPEGAPVPSVLLEHIADETGIVEDVMDPAEVRAILLMLMSELPRLRGELESRSSERPWLRGKTVLRAVSNVATIGKLAVAVLVATFSTGLVLGAYLALHSSAGLPGGAVACQSPPQAPAAARSDH